METNGHRERLYYRSGLYEPENIANNFRKIKEE